MGSNGGMRSLGASLLFTFTLAAADLLIQPAALEPQLKDPKLVLLHVGTKQDYDAGHIAGAQLVTLADLSVSGDLRLQMPPVETLQNKLMAMGIGNGSRVVIYAGNESVQSATRIFFTFDYLSLEARLLDGGLAAWKAAGKPVVADVPVIKPATGLQVKARPELIVDAGYIEAHLKDPALALIDARTPEFYSGASAGNMPRAGHIPGARNVPFPTLLGPNKEFLSTGELAAKLGDKPIVTYCHIGMQATVVYFSARLADKPVRLYDGSFEEWSKRKELPVEAQQ